MDEIGTVAPLPEKDATFVLIAPGPLPKLLKYREEQGWSFPWYSSFGSTFNQDFRYTTHEDNEIPGSGVFLSNGENVYHTSSTTGRGVPPLLITDGFLDMTPGRRQEDWEDSPAG